MTTLQPIEAVEQLYPVRIERTALREDSGGPGRWRGGLGLTREVRIHVAGSRLSVLAEKAVLEPSLQYGRSYLDALAALKA